MNTHDYKDLPPEAPQPRMWKSLGHVVPGIEPHYGLERWSGELDEDAENDLKAELYALGDMLTDRGRDVLDMVMAQQFGRYLIVRFVACSCGTNLYTTRN